MNTRLAYLAGVLVCLGLMGAGLYLQYIEHQEPCPMCILQRIAYIALIVLFGIAAMHGPRRTGAAVYSTLIVLAAAAGAAVAARQVWLQHLPKDQVPACGPGLEYMMRKFPLYETLQKVLAGSGECAEAGWHFLGLSIAGWSLVWFVLLGGYAVYIALRARRQHAGAGLTLKSRKFAGS
ncbi:MAG TPA: disulfide bond formation protein B [Burkholderiales bacterium]